jgi:hypothetical protein
MTLSISQARGPGGTTFTHTHTHTHTHAHTRTTYTWLTLHGREGRHTLLGMQEAEGQNGGWPQAEDDECLGVPIHLPLWKSSQD